MPPCGYAKAVRFNWMTCGTGMMVDGGRGPGMFFDPVPRCSASLTNILLRTVNVRALVFLYDPTLF